MERSGILSLLLVVTGIIHLVFGDCSDPNSPYTIDQPKGSIQSPGYPNYYKANENCVWNLNPPERTLPELLIVNVVLETDVGNNTGSPSCENPENYVSLGNIKGCDREGPICIGFMLLSSSYSCHAVQARHFPHCISMLHRNWPFNVEFHTKQASSMKGFKLDYQFVDCNSYDPNDETLLQHGHDSTVASNPGNVAAVETTSPHITAKSTTTSLITAKSTATALITTKSTTTENIKSGKSSTPHSTLIIVFVVLCVLFVFLVTIFIFRRRIKRFTRKEKSLKKSNGLSTNNNNTINFVEGCVIPSEKVPPVHTYPQTFTTHIPSVSSSVSDDSVNNMSNYVRFSTVSENGRENPVFNASERYQ